MPQVGTQVVPPGQVLLDLLTSSSHVLANPECTNLQKEFRKIYFIFLEGCKFPFSVIINRHEGRHSERSAANNKLYVPKEPRINCTGFSYLGPKLYNMLTAEIKNARSMDDFKTKLMEWIWKNIH